MPVTENCDLRGADPGCYGCQGTGKIRWAGVDPETRCPCTRWCSNHDRQCDDEDGDVCEGCGYDDVKIVNGAVVTTHALDCPSLPPIGMDSVR